MSKLIKTVGSLLLFVCLLGLVLLFVAGTEKGAAVIEKTVAKLTDGNVHVDTSALQEWGDAVGEEVQNTFDDLNDMSANLNYEISDTGYFDKSHEILSGDVEKYSLGNEIHNLDIDAGGCVLTMEESEDENFYVQVKNAGKFQGYTEGNTLCIRYVTSTQKPDALDSCEIILWIPAGHVFTKAEIEVGAGKLDCQELNGGEISLEVGAGQITVQQLAASDAEISVGMGNIGESNKSRQLVGGYRNGKISGRRFSGAGSGNRVLHGRCGIEAERKADGFQL